MCTSDFESTPPLHWACVGLHWACTGFALGCTGLHWGLGGALGLHWSENFVLGLYWSENFALGLLLLLACLPACIYKTPKSKKIAYIQDAMASQMKTPKS